MSTNFLKLLKPDKDVSHSGFDLSQKHVFSTKPGLITPCLAIETVPNDKFSIDMAAITRTETLNTAAFLRGKYRFDFFFIPFVQLWHPFEQFITQRDDKHSTMQLDHKVCPVIELSAILNFLAVQFDSIYRGNEHVDCFYDVHGAPMCYNAVRLLDMLGYGDFRWLQNNVLSAGLNDLIVQDIDQYDGKYINIFRLAAYQHVFYDYYRNQYWDNEMEDDVHSFSHYGRNYLDFFNFDDIQCSLGNNIVCTRSDASLSASTANAWTRRLAGLLTMRYSQYKKDIFNAALPSTQFGAVSSVNLDLSNISFEVTDSQPISVNNAYFPIFSNTHANSVRITSPNGFEGKWNVSNAFDVLQLRKAELLQQWKQNALRAGNKTNDAFRAHFGVEPYYYQDNEVRYLGSYESALDINPVETTAASATAVNNRVGDLAGIGMSITKGDKISLETRDFGVIVAFEHFVPDVEYRSQMIDKANRLYEDFDFFTSEFQNAGLDPVLNIDFNGRLERVEGTNVIGFAPRYWQYKQAISKCHGEFGEGGVFQAWVAPRIDGIMFSSQTGHRELSQFYVRPDFLNSVFGVSDDDKQSSDMFIHNVFFDVKAIRPMSVLGIPQF